MTTLSLSERQQVNLLLRATRPRKASVSPTSASPEDMLKESKAVHTTVCPQDYLSWTVAKRRSWDRRYTSPTNYFYHYEHPSFIPKSGVWSVKEHFVFLAALQRFPARSSWAAFSLLVPGRAGSECRRYFQLIVRAGFVSSSGEIKGNLVCRASVAEELKKKGVSTTKLSSANPLFLRRSLRKFIPEKLPSIDDSLLMPMTNEQPVVSEKASLQPKAVPTLALSTAENDRDRDPVSIRSNSQKRNLRDKKASNTDRKDRRKFVRTEAKGRNDSLLSSPPCVDSSQSSLHAGHKVQNRRETVEVTLNLASCPPEDDSGDVRVPRKSDFSDNRKPASNEHVSLRGYNSSSQPSGIVQAFGNDKPSTKGSTVPVVHDRKDTERKGNLIIKRKAESDRRTLCESTKRKKVALLRSIQALNPRSRVVVSDIVPDISDVKHIGRRQQRRSSDINLADTSEKSHLSKTEFRNGNLRSASIPERCGDGGLQASNTSSQTTKQLSRCITQQTSQNTCRDAHISNAGSTCSSEPSSSTDADCYPSTPSRSRQIITSPSLESRFPQPMSPSSGVHASECLTNSREYPYNDDSLQPNSTRRCGNDCSIREVERSKQERETESSDLVSGVTDIPSSTISTPVRSTRSEDVSSCSGREVKRIGAEQQFRPGRISPFTESAKTNVGTDQDNTDTTKGYDSMLVAVESWSTRKRCRALRPPATKTSLVATPTRAPETKEKCAPYRPNESSGTRRSVPSTHYEGQVQFCSISDQNGAHSSTTSELSDDSEIIPRFKSRTREHKVQSLSRSEKLSRRINCTSENPSVDVKFDVGTPITLSPRAPIDLSSSSGLHHNEECKSELCAEMRTRIHATRELIRMFIDTIDCRGLAMGHKHQRQLLLRDFDQQYHRIISNSFVEQDQKSVWQSFLAYFTARFQELENIQRQHLLANRMLSKVLF